MTTPPARPKIYHITHVDNLGAIANERALVSDAEMIRRGGPSQTIGMSEIKRRRVEELPVPCHPGTKVGDYVPFYFCPRSVMLYVISRGNHPELTYREGQGPIVHLEADLHAVVDWVEQNGGLWAFSLSNAGAYYTQFKGQIQQLDQINWDAVAAANFQREEIKEGKQAEFLVYESFPFHLVDRIGVCNRQTERAVEDALAGTPHQPKVMTMPEWYF